MLMNFRHLLNLVTHSEATHSKGRRPNHPGLVPHVGEALLHAVPRPDVVHDGLVVRGDADLLRDAAGVRNNLELGAGVQPLVEHPHLPGLCHLLRHQAAAAELLLRLVPGPGHDVVPVVGVVGPDVRDHLRLDGVDGLLPEDVCQHASNNQNHKEEKHENNIRQK